MKNTIHIKTTIKEQNVIPITVGVHKCIIGRILFVTICYLKTKVTDSNNDAN